MEELHAEVGLAQLSKVGEELCGDKIELVRTPDSTIVVLSDGLGSGVKANILATLTTKIASSMLQRRIPLDEVLATIAETLPVCRQRKIAYSTFQILQIDASGLATIVEFDCPQAFVIRGGKVVSFPTHEKSIAGKLTHIGQLLLQEDDIVVCVSDGVIHAGIGGLLKLGWNWQGIARYLESEYEAGWDADVVVRRVINCCEGYYLSRPGDDSSVVAVRLRRPRYLTLLTGPPAEPAHDEAVVKRFLSQPGVKIVAGGTTANIVSRLIRQPLHVDLSYYDPEIPPTGRLKGIDLVTEGVLTLNAAVDRIQHSQRLHNPTYQDGATLLARQLLHADKIFIFAGTAVNPAHQNPNFPLGINLKAQVLDKLKQALAERGKQIEIEWL
ncbi:MAG: SpoIIE family protein phosphatase [Sporomusaceae bacterium]|nr:SpoIIE family protein phosphatase [Sporomusaceae bacterium]